MNRFRISLSFISAAAAAVFAYQLQQFFPGTSYRQSPLETFPLPYLPVLTSCICLGLLAASFVGTGRWRQLSKILTGSAASVGAAAIFVIVGVATLTNADHRDASFRRADGNTAVTASNGGISLVVPSGWLSDGVANINPPSDTAPGLWNEHDAIYINRPEGHPVGANGSCSNDEPYCTPVNSLEARRYSYEFIRVLWNQSIIDADGYAQYSKQAVQASKIRLDGSGFSVLKTKNGIELVCVSDGYLKLIAIDGASSFEQVPADLHAVIGSIRFKR